MQNRCILTPFFLDDASPGLELLARPAWSVNKPALHETGTQRRMSALHQPIADFVAATVAAGDRPVSIAGDCCTTIGVVAGLQRAGVNPALLWFDAHGDFNTWETTPSGFLGGMPLAMLVGRGEQTLAQAVGLRPFPEDHVLLFDGRDLDPGEREALARSAVHHVRDIHAVPDHPLVGDPVYVHLDTDIITPDDAPAMKFPAPGGPTVAELRTAFRSLTQAADIVAVSLSAWTPELDADNRTQATCMELFGILFGA